MDEVKVQQRYRGVPKSPTGRTPKWALDEAMGRPTQPVAFRTYTLSACEAQGLAPMRRRVGTMALVIALLGAGVVTVGALSARDAGTTPGVVASQRQPPPPGLDESARTAPSQAELPGPEGQGFRFLAHQPGSAQPVTWSPGRPVHYVLRPDNAPVDGAAMIAQAVAAVSTATGLRFVADGPTSEGPSEDRSAYQPDLYGDRWSPVLIAWATPDEVPDFGVDIAGEAGPSGVTTPSGDTTYVSGIVYLDGAQLGEISASSGVAAATSVVTRELGHLVGLAHVNDPGQLMYPRSGSQVHYGAGDLAGLAALGRGACQPDI